MSSEMVNWLWNATLQYNCNSIRKAITDKIFYSDFQVYKVTKLAMPYDILNVSRVRNITIFEEQ